MQRIFAFFLTFSLIGLQAMADEPKARQAVPPPVGNGRPDLHIDAQIQGRLDENRLIMLAEYHLSAAGPGVISLQDSPLVLPVLAPVIGDVVLDQGVLPRAGQAMELESSGTVKAERQDGWISVQGKVVAGQEAIVRLQYYIGFSSSHLALGMTGRGERTWFTFALQGQAPARVRIDAPGPARMTKAEEGANRLVGLGIAHPLADGELAVLELDDLPGPPARLQKSLLLGALAILSVAVLAIGRRRQPAGLATAV